MSRIPVLLPLAIAALWLGTVSPAGAGGDADPAAALRLFLAAGSDGDPAGALARLTDDAVVGGLALCDPVPCVGRPLWSSAASGCSTEAGTVSVIVPAAASTAPWIGVACGQITHFSPLEPHWPLPAV